MLKIQKIKLKYKKVTILKKQKSLSNKHTFLTISLQKIVLTEFLIAVLIFIVANITIVEMCSQIGFWAL